MPVLRQREQRQHSSGSTFLGAIGIIALRFTSRAGARVMYLRHTRAAKLPNDLGCEIDLVMRRPNTGAELRDNIRSLGTELLVHLSNRGCDDPALRAFAPRMN